MKENKFVLVVQGDWGEIYQAIFDYDWREESAKDIYVNQILNNRMFDDDDDPDSTCTVRIVIDGLDHLSDLLVRWMPVAEEIGIWASGESDTAVFEIGLSCRNKKNSINLLYCKSKLQSKEGKLAEAAIRAKKIIEEAQKT